MILKMLAGDDLEGSQGTSDLVLLILQFIEVFMTSFYLNLFLKDVTRCYQQVLVLTRGDIWGAEIWKLLWRCMKSEIKSCARSFKLLLKYVKHKYKPESEIRIFLDSWRAAQRQLPEWDWWTQPKPAHNSATKWNKRLKLSEFLVWSLLQQFSFTNLMSYLSDESGSAFCKFSFQTHPKCRNSIILRVFAVFSY
jgi:hypothetical protein